MIKVNLKNYKLLKDKEFTLEGSSIYFIQGKNNLGKTSLKDAIAGLQLGKLPTKEKVSRGEKEGSIEMSIPGADGQQYIIRHTFDIDGNERFVAVGPEGKRITSVTEIRNIFKYTHITATEFLEYSKTEKGRRDQTKLLLSFLTDDEKNAYDSAVEKEKLAYDNRANAKRILDTLNVEIKSKELSEDDNKLLLKYDDLKKKYSEIEHNWSESKATKEKIKNLTQTLDTLKSQFINIATKVKEDIVIDEKYKKDLTIVYNAIKNQYESKIAELNKISDTDKLESEKNELNETITKCSKLETLREECSKLVLTRNKKQEEWNTLDKDVEHYRFLKKKILKDSNLPIDQLDITDDGITIDGFSFTENQISTSKAIKIVANIMCKLNQSTVLLMGDASQLDWDSIEELAKVAEENGKIMIFDEVVRDKEEIEVVSYNNLK